MTVVIDFINEQGHMGRKKVCVIHGKGEGILKETIHRSLKRNKMVDRFYLYNYNIGCTIIELK